MNLKVSWRSNNNLFWTNSSERDNVYENREKASNQIQAYNLEAKWTYKAALGMAIESNNDEIYELVCVVETHKMMPKNEKETEKQWTQQSVETV